MQLVLMRHAIAEQRSERWPDDSQRPLTRQGERKHRQISDTLRRMGVTFDQIATSPFVRARQTAEITARAYGWEEEIVETEALASGFGFTELVGFLESHAPEATVLCVGHEPDLSQFAGRLLHASGDVEIDFKKSGVMGLDLPEGLRPGGGVLLWFLKPGHAARVARRG